MKFGRPAVGAKNTTIDPLGDSLPFIYGMLGNDTCKALPTSSRGKKGSSIQSGHSGFLSINSLGNSSDFRVNREAEGPSSHRALLSSTILLLLDGDWGR